MMYFGSILPTASVSKRLKASRSSSISSAVSPGLSVVFFCAPLAGGLTPPLISWQANYKYLKFAIKLNYFNKNKSIPSLHKICSTCFNQVFSMISRFHKLQQVSHRQIFSRFFLPVMTFFCLMRWPPFTLLLLTLIFYLQLFTFWHLPASSRIPEGASEKRTFFRILAIYFMLYEPKLSSQFWVMIKIYFYTIMWSFWWWVFASLYVQSVFVGDDNLLFWCLAFCLSFLFPPENISQTLYPIFQSFAEIFYYLSDLKIGVQSKIYIVLLKHKRKVWIFKVAIWSWS